MLLSRSSPGVAVLDRKIYVTGGGFGFGRTTSHAECYDPATDTWSRQSASLKSQVASMNIAREGHELIALHGRLYSIGGYNGGFGESNVVDSVEVYDPGNNTWTILPQKLEGEGFGCGSGLIKKYYVE